MRLIDVDNLIILDYIRDKNTGEKIPVVDLEQIKNAPTVNAVEVVRCKDCKYRNTITKKCVMLDHYYMMHGIKFIGNGRQVDDDFYCALGIEKCQKED